jgi:hypothetical protein
MKAVLFTGVASMTASISISGIHISKSRKARQLKAEALVPEGLGF